MERDQANQAALLALGWNVIVVWECEISDASALRERLRREILSSVKT